MPDTKTDALNFIRREGPIQPSQLASELNTNILFASAILSELVSNKHAKITSVKKGGSPFYYVKGQEAKLEELQTYLGGKPKEALWSINQLIQYNDLSQVVIPERDTSIKPRPAFN